MKTKMKSFSGAAKRFRKTANGFKCKQSHKNHILTKKPSKRKRQLKNLNQVEKSDLNAVERMLPYA